jgi:transcriptional regulator with XRE-family HTH domain
MTQAALAAKVGAHSVYISQLERSTRTPSMAMLRKISAALRVPLAELVK